MGINQKSVAVIGAGISGLVLAYQLKKQGHAVTVFESSAEAGGKIKTIYREGFELDLGPVSCSETEPLRQLISELNLQNEVLPAQSAVSKRYIYSKGKVHGIEPSPPKLFTHPMLSLGGKLKLLRDLWMKPAREQIEDETVAQFVTRHFGKEAHQKLFNPVLNGIYAGDSEVLSITSTLPLVKRLAKQYGSVIKGLRMEKDKLKLGRQIISMKGGFSKLIRAIETYLGNDLHRSAEVVDVDLVNGKASLTVMENSSERQFIFDNIFFTIPSFASALLLKRYDSEVAEALAKIKYNQVTQIYCEVDMGANSFDGFGFLVPAEEKLSLLGAICISNIFPQKSPDDKKLFALFCGGDRPYPFEAKTADAVNQFKSILKPLSLEVLHVQEWNNAIPQFHVGHQTVLQKLKDFEAKNPAVVFAGNYVSGVSLGDCIQFATQLAVEKQS
jgi:oxygen-dependent protoporphyrinogen oxidase